MTIALYIAGYLAIAIPFAIVVGRLLRQHDRPTE